MRTRKKEIELLVELLSQEHDDVELLATDVWKLIDGARRDRDIYIVATRVAGGVNLLYGPYESETLAQRDVDVGSVKGVDSGDRYQVMKVLSPSKIFDSSEPTLFDVR